MDENLLQPKKPRGATVLLTLFCLCLLGAMLGMLIGVMLGMMNGIDPQIVIQGLSEASKPEERGFVRLFLALNHLFLFFLPGVLIAVLFHKKGWQKWLGLERLPRSSVIFWSLLFLLVSMPFVQYSYFLNKLIPLPEWAKMAEDSTADAIKALLVMDSPIELLINVFVIAVLPGLGEEIVFRGIVQKTFEGFFKNGHVAVWMAAIVFSAIHFQFEGFLPRMFLGAALGYLYLFTQNLWVPILAHIFNNGAQVVGQYLYGKELSTIDLEQEINVPIWGAILSIGLTVFLGYFIYQKYRPVKMMNDKMINGE